MTVLAPIDGTSLAPDRDVIGHFLRNYVGAAVHLVAIEPDGPACGCWFGEDAVGATDWAIRQNEAGKGVYWTVNECQPGVNKKCSRADIVAQRFLHVDIDPPKDDSAFNVAERAAALACLPLEPSFVIASGGGLGAFWRLDAPLHDAPACTEANKALETLLGGDHCHNVDRVMRLPGTINWPNAKKRAAGRVPAMATILESDVGVCHRFADLTAAYPLVSVPVASAPDKASNEPMPAHGDVAWLTADDLKLSRFDPIRSLIEYPAGDDRSRDALACAGEMARAGYSDEQILGVLLNPANAVHAHLSAQRDPRYQAMRCLARAREECPVASPINAWPALDLIACAAQSAPIREWMVSGWVPANKATLVAGDGGVGKSLIEQLKATCVALGRDFLGLPTRQANAAYLSWEDDADELWRRQEAICAALGIDMADLTGRLHLVSYTEAENPFLVVAADDGVRVTPLGKAIEQLVDQHAIGLLVLDNASQIAGIDHNAVEQVAPFAHWLGTIAKRCRGAVLLLHHTNKAGQDYLGSVAYNNQFRSRLLLARPADCLDPDVRVLSNPKANYSRAGNSIEVRWFNGSFVRDEDLPVSIREQAARSSSTMAEDAAFLCCLRARAAQGDGRQVGPAPGPNYAPAQFEGMAEAKGLPRAKLKQAMDRLFAAGIIESQTVRNTAKGRDVTVVVERSIAPRTPPRTLPEHCSRSFPNPHPNHPAHTLPPTGGRPPGAVAPGEAGL